MSLESLENQVNKIDRNLENLTSRITDWQQDHIQKLAVFGEKTQEQARDIDNLANAIRERDVRCRNEEQSRTLCVEKIKNQEAAIKSFDTWRTEADMFLNRLKGLAYIVGIITALIGAYTLFIDKA